MLPISRSVRLDLLRMEHAKEVHSLIEKNRSHLARWFAWAPSQTLQATREFIRAGEEQAVANDGFHAVVICQGHIAGVISYMSVNWQHRRTVLGYWLDIDHRGKGLMTCSVRALVDHALLAWELNRVEIRVAVGNRQSQAIPERLGFRKEAMLRQAELVNGCYLDTFVYAMLAADWTRASVG